MFLLGIQTTTVTDVYQRPAQNSTVSVKSWTRWVVRRSCDVVSYVSLCFFYTVSRGDSVGGVTLSCNDSFVLAPETPEHIVTAVSLLRESAAWHPLL